MAILGLSAVDESSTFTLGREERGYGQSPQLAQGGTGGRLPAGSWALLCSATAASLSVLALADNFSEDWILRGTDLKVETFREGQRYQSFRKAYYKLKRTSSASILFIIMLPLWPHRRSFCYFYFFFSNYVAYLILLLYLSEVRHSPSERLWPKCESHSWSCICPSLICCLFFP